MRRTWLWTGSTSGSWNVTFRASSVCQLRRLTARSYSRTTSTLGWALRTSTSRCRRGLPPTDEMQQEATLAY